MKLTEKRNGKIIGYITWRRVGKPKHKLIELMHIEVDKQYRHKGIGTKLFNGMLKRIDYRKLFLTTHASNYEAQEFYDKMGMEYETSLKKHYYPDENEYVYSKFKKKKPEKKPHVTTLWKPSK